jgi:hypothetical protein
VSAAFDGGSIDVVDASNPGDVQLKLKREPFTVRPSTSKIGECECTVLHLASLHLAPPRSSLSPFIDITIAPPPLPIRQEGTDKKSHAQFFHFRVDNPPQSSPQSPSSASSTQCTFRIIDAGTASYPEAWAGYHVAYSYDRETWPRIQDTTYDADTGELRWTWADDRGDCGGGGRGGPVWFSYFAPYSYERHQDLIARCGGSTTPQCEAGCLGLTLDGRSIDVLKVGTGKTVVWVNARQHPGETMAEWYEKEGEGVRRRVCGEIEREGEGEGGAESERERQRELERGMGRDWCDISFGKKRTKERGELERA